MLTRRQTLSGAANAVVGTLVAGTFLAKEASARPKHRRAHGTKAAPQSEWVAKPLPFDAGKLTGLSERLIRSHHDNNYAGAVRKLNRVRQVLATLPTKTPTFEVGALKSKELAFANSVSLHELYFGNLGGDGKPVGEVLTGLDQSFGPFERFEAHFKTLGKALGGGSGWVILGYDLLAKTFTLSPSSGHPQARVATYPLLVLDMYEHSYHMEYGTKAGQYIEAFWGNLNWKEINRRYKLAASFGI